MKKLAIIGSILTALPGLVSATQPALAGTATSSFKVSITITKDCAVSAPSDIILNSGSGSLVVSGAKGTTSFNVVCPVGTGYKIGFAGVNDVSADTATHSMNSASTPATYISYQLTDTTAGASNPKPLSATSSLISDTGNGSPQAKTVQAQVVNTTTAPATGTYTDTVTLTVTY